MMEERINHAMALKSELNEETYKRVIASIVCNHWVNELKKSQLIVNRMSLLMRVNLSLKKYHIEEISYGCLRSFYDL